MNTIYTIGHSNHPIADFVAMLRAFDIRVLADIRSMPGSNRYPHFNQSSLEKSLGEAGITYVHIPELGGRRKPRPDSVNTAWRSKAFMGYADYMETEEFRMAIKKLEEIAIKQRTAYMCAEVLWWQCHRSLVSDYLKINGWHVIHIMTKDKSVVHPYTSPARPIQGNLFYDDLK